ncbi:MAG: hypothetical protein ACE37E_01105 [Hyphomicrobiales bacterium]
MGYLIQKSEDYSAKNREWMVVDADGEVLSVHLGRSKACRARNQYILEDTLRGKRLCQQEPLNADGKPTERRTWFIEPGGKSFSGPLAEDLIKRGALVPVGDALFPGMTQTYELAE